MTAPRRAIDHVGEWRWPRSAGKPERVEGRRYRAESWDVVWQGGLRLETAYGGVDPEIIYSRYRVPEVGGGKDASAPEPVRADELVTETLRGLGRPVVVSGHQPCYHAYLPIVARLIASDIFTVADDMRFGRQQYQHRQRFGWAIKPVWATVPVARSGVSTAIREKVIGADERWRQKHWQVIQRTLGSKPHFPELFVYLDDVYAKPWKTLCSCLPSGLA